MEVLCNTLLNLHNTNNTCEIHLQKLQLQPKTIFME